MPFVYAVLSLICTAVHEWLVALLQLRAKTLKSGLIDLLDDASVALSEPFYAHTEIRALTAATAHPSYLCPATFARVLVDVITATETAVVEARQIIDAVQAMPAGRLRSALLNLLRHVNLADPDACHQIQQRIENWFNAAMQRTGAAYQRSAQLITCAIAFAICVSVNADSVRIAQVLWSSPTVRTHVTTAATNNPHQPSSRIQIEEQLGSLLSWSDDVKDSGCNLGDAAGWRAFLLWSIPRRLAGWLLTTVAISLGAPFWFDTLNRFVRLRIAEPKPEAAPNR